MTKRWNRRNSYALGAICGVLAKVAFWLAVAVLAMLVMQLGSGQWG